MFKAVRLTFCARKPRSSKMDLFSHDCYFGGGCVFVALKHVICMGTKSGDLSGSAPGDEEPLAARRWFLHVD